MNQILEHIRSFAVLFLVVTLLIHLVPGEQLKKYIRFFGELVLTLGFLYPVFQNICGNGGFLELISYEEFSQELEQLARDTEKVSFLKEDYYRAAYEEAIASDVEQMAEREGYDVEAVQVALTGEYAMESIYLRLSGEEKIVIGVISEEEKTDYGTLRQKLADYYGVEEKDVVIEGGEE